MKKSLIAIVLSTALIAFCSQDKEDKMVGVSVFKASGSITTTIDSFRQLLGKLNTGPGARSGRREINWDGVPDDFLNKTLPDDFFNPVGNHAPAARQRGLSYASGQNFQVSKNNFAGVNFQAATEFAAFSGDKTFTNISTNLWDVGFKVAGQTTAASVKGFGMVFSDVDKINTTSMEFFEDTKSLGKYYVPPHSGSGNFSFLGVYFPDHTITRVQVSHEGILANNEKDVSQNGTKDLVIMDDFIYSEPVAK